MEPVVYPSFATKDQLAHTSLKFSPHAENILAIGSAANFGIVGKGNAQIRALDGKTIKVIATLEEKVTII